MTRLRIFVFGSNLAGRHGKGAALDAVRDYGAIRGRGTGRQGNAYAIATKDAALCPLSLEAIAAHVQDFVAYARAHPELDFLVTDVGCGLAGYVPTQIAPLFRAAPANCLFSARFRAVLERGPGAA